MKNSVLLRRVDSEPGLCGVEVNSDEILGYSRGHDIVEERNDEVFKVCPHGIVPGDSEDKVGSGDYKRRSKANG